MACDLKLGDLVRVIQRNGKLSARLYTVDCIIPAIDAVYIRAVGMFATHEYRPEQIAKVEALDLAA